MLHHKNHILQQAEQGEPGSEKKPMIGQYYFILTCWADRTKGERAAPEKKTKKHQSSVNRAFIRPFYSKGSRFLLDSLNIDVNLPSQWVHTTSPLEVLIRTPVTRVIVVFKRELLPHSWTASFIAGSEAILWGECGLFRTAASESLWVLTSRNQDGWIDGSGWWWFPAG